MTYSMTGYASADQSDALLAVSIEIRSYNSRYLDINLRIPPAYAGLEDPVKKIVSRRLSRGRIEVRIDVEITAEDQTAYAVRQDRAAALDRALAQVTQDYGWNVSVPVDFLLGHAGIIAPVQATIDADRCRQLVVACLDAALDDLIGMRQTEGAHIAGDLAERIDAIENRLAAVRQGADGLVALYRQRLTERIGALTGGMTAIDPDRVAQEAAFLADRSDISEEIVRAESHLKQFRDILSGSAPAGRKLNFLLQEINREFNTMGAKVGNADLAHIIVAVKAELEKIREQVQNIE